MHKSLVIQLEPQLPSNRNCKSYIFRNNNPEKPSIDFNTQLGKSKIVQSVKYAKDSPTVSSTQKVKTFTAKIKSFLVFLLVQISSWIISLWNCVKLIFGLLWKSCSCMLIFLLLVLGLALGITVGYLNDSLWLSDYMMVKTYIWLWNAKDQINILSLVGNEQ